MDSFSSKAQDCGYARSRILGAFSFFELNKADSAVLWSALAFVDSAGTNRVNVADFAKVFCPNSIEVLLILWDKYTWEKPKKAFKVGVVHVDEDDPDAIDDLKNEEELQGKEKERHMKEMEEYKKKLSERNTPTYVQFICFLLFFMTTTDATLPRWLYWLWFHIPKRKPSVDLLLKMATEIWPKTHNSKEKYSFAVRKGVKVVDEGFDAATFGIYNSKTGGAFSRPAMMVKDEIYTTLIGASFWNRVAVCVGAALADIGQSMEKLEDRKLKGTPTLYASKGERKVARREMRKFLSKYVSYSTMPTNQEVMDQGKGVILPMIKNIIINSVKSVRSLSGKVDLSSRSDFVRRIQISRKLAAWHESRKKDRDDMAAEASANAAVDHAHETHVPLEWKYRKQIKWPQQLINIKVDGAREKAKALVDRVKNEVVSTKFILHGPLGDDDDGDDDDGWNTASAKSPAAGSKGDSSDDDDDDE